jgi:DNA-directed RNA polymerase alpha subunit
MASHRGQGIAMRHEQVIEQLHSHPFRAINRVQQSIEQTYMENRVARTRVKRPYRKLVRQVEWTSGLPTRCANALRAHGFTSRDQLERVTEQALMRIPHIGIRSVADICNWLGRSPIDALLSISDKPSNAEPIIEVTVVENLEFSK